MEHEMETTILGLWFRFGVGLSWYDASGKVGRIGLEISFAGH